jgi:putative Holliday junction resolvase
VLDNRGDDALAVEIAQVAGRHGVTRAVIGVPRNMDGSFGPRAKYVEAFAKKLEAALALPVVRIDERLTTRQAERVLLEADVSRARRRRVVDKMAAALILQGYLDRGSGLGDQGAGVL